MDCFERAWLVIAAGQSRTHGGNDGYDDEIENFYSWDSTVAHYRDLKIDDHIVLRSKHSLIGAGVLEDIEIWSGSKIRYRCTNKSCSSTKIKKRSSKVPIYNCQVCKIPFETPGAESIEVVNYRGHYGNSFVHLTGIIDIKFLRQLSYYKPGSSHSMQPMNYGAFVEELRKLGRYID